MNGTNSSIPMDPQPLVSSESKSAFASSSFNITPMPVAHEWNSLRLSVLSLSRSKYSNVSLISLYCSGVI